MQRCSYQQTKPTAHPSQSKREVLCCQCLDCKDARRMKDGLLISLRKAVRERFHALNWEPEPPHQPEDAA